MPKLVRHNGEQMFFQLNINKDMPLQVKGFPINLIIGWNLTHYRNGTLADMVPGMERIMNVNAVEIHPREAKKRNLKDGDPVRLKTSGGATFDGHILTSDRIPSKTVYMSLSSMAFTPNFRYCSLHPVKIEKGNL